MKIHTVILASIVALLLSGMALAQSGGGSKPSALYSVERSTVSGGAYRLTSLARQVSGTASGGRYRLLSPAAPTLRGSGCCCTYLPCVLRNRQ